MVTGVYVCSFPSVSSSLLLPYFLMGTNTTLDMIFQIILCSLFPKPKGEESQKSVKHLAIILEISGKEKFIMNLNWSIESPWLF